MHIRKLPGKMAIVGKRSYLLKEEKKKVMEQPKHRPKEGNQ
jgi:hypothetical protein